MKFESIENLISLSVLSHLPGEKAHKLMEPIGRSELIKKAKITHASPKKSAVMLLLYPIKGESHLILIKRPSYPGVHSGQIALPGGKHEDNESMLECALRETFEEVGVADKEIMVVRELSPLYIPPSNFLVNPFIGLSQKQPEFIPQVSEVDEIIEMPVAHLLDDKNKGIRLFSNSMKSSIDAPYYEFNGHIIWGATAMILSEFVQLIKNA
jgi:8-oxo-dGTP pyrophosphatase MutT (NUDIX family)